MAYIGNDLQVAYQSYQIIDDISGSFNGSTTSFALLVGGVAPVPFPINEQQCLISVGGVIQEPDPTGTNGFKFSGGNIVFSSAPGTGEDFFGVILAGADYVNVGVNYPSGSESAPSITFDTDLDTGIYNPAANELGLVTNGNDAVRINSSGDVTINSDLTVDTDTLYVDSANDRVGIGTTAPAAKLEVQDGSISIGSSINATTTNTLIAGYGYILSGTKYGNTSIRSTYLNFDNSASLEFYVADYSTNTNERMRLDSSGRLLVGTSSAFYNFNTELVSNNNVLAVVDTNPFNTGSRVAFTVRTGTYSATDTTSLYMNMTRGDGTQRGRIRSNGATAVAYESASDYRLKENVVSLTNALQRLSLLKPYQFNFIEDGPERTVDGFFAHEIQEVVPEAAGGVKDEVDENGNPVYQGIDQAKLVPLLTAALQEALGRIETLEAEVAALKAS